MSMPSPPDIRATPVLSGEVVDHRTPDEWAVIIRDDLANSVGGIVAAGRHLIEAKAQIPHGEWGPWVDGSLPFSESYARRLMEIARHPSISNREFTLVLPPSAETLYLLSRLDAAALQLAVDSGAVHPQLQQKQAKALVAEYRIHGDGDGRRISPAVDGQIGTIVADPPWRYGNTSTRGAAADHYPTMSIDDIADLEIPHKHTGEQAHLYLWTTAGHLPEAFGVMERWGFEYKTYLVWVKPQMGMGNYFRVSTELVLFGIRGELRTNDRATMNYFEARRGKHSKKPLAFYDLVTKCSPGPYLEMFSRCRADDMLDGLCECSKCRLGWQVWGNES